MSEFLDRLLSEVRERLAASRDAVREYEQLERALAALDGADDGAPPQRSARRSPSASAPVRRRRALPAGRPAGAAIVTGLALVGEQPGVTHEELQGVTGFSVAVVAQNLRRMVARGELREQQLPGGQIRYATSAIDPDTSPSTANATDDPGAETASASNRMVAEIP